MTCIRVPAGEGFGRAILCEDIERLTTPNPRCPNAAAHTPGPKGYIAWFNWADEMARTHRQRRCDGCGLLVIWEPKGAPDGD